MKESIDDLIENYDNKKGGNIAVLYPESQEKLCYEGIAKILYLSYGTIISYDEIMERLSKRR